MKNFLLALMVVLTTCTLAIAQNQTTVVRDSVGKVKVTVTKDNKAKTNNTAVTVIGVDTADTDSTEVDANSSNVSTGHGKASFTFESDADDFPFHGFGINGGILVAIISIIAVFGFPVFILFVIFFFRYKNRKARYRLAEQALAAGQPLPAEFIRENKNDFRSNVTNGGTMTPCTPSKAEIETAIKACNTLGLTFGGVDILDDGSVCEVNSNAHIINIMNSTKIDIAPYIFETIKGKIL